MKEKFQQEVERSTLYSFDGPFHLIHVGVGNLEFLGKRTTTPRYVLLADELYSSEVYVDPMRSRKQILQKMKQFYEDIKNKKNMKKTTHLHVNNEFQQVKIKDLNDVNNVEIFTSSVRGGKTLAAEQKIRELKSRVTKLNALKIKVTPTKIITTSSENMNCVLNEKYGLSPNEIEKRSLSRERFRILFNFRRIGRKKLTRQIGQVQ